MSLCCPPGRQQPPPGAHLPPWPTWPGRGTGPGQQERPSCGQMGGVQGGREESFPKERLLAALRTLGVLRPRIVSSFTTWHSPLNCVHIMAGVERSAGDQTTLLIGSLQGRARAKAGPSRSTDPARVMPPASRHGTLPAARGRRDPERLRHRHRAPRGELAASWLFLASRCLGGTPGINCSEMSLPQRIWHPLGPISVAV